MYLLTAVEPDGIAADHDSAPPSRWGTADLQTDARLALLIERGASEALLVNGSELHAGGDAIVSLPARRAIVRVAQVARAVQET
jgi:hypothetical protein